MRINLKNLKKSGSEKAKLNEIDKNPQRNPLYVNLMPDEEQMISGGGYYRGSGS